MLPVLSSATFVVRRANRSDAADIAAAHLDSIRSIGPRYYPAAVVEAWSAGVRADKYTAAMARGEVFFVAIDRRSAVVGFSSHRVDDGVHGISVYVRGDAARKGVGSGLLLAAEVAAVAAGAAELRIDASLPAVEFYTNRGFAEVGRGEYRIAPGQRMACVAMRKDLS